MMLKQFMTSRSKIQDSILVLSDKTSANHGLSKRRKNDFQIKNTRSIAQTHLVPSVWRLCIGHPPHLFFLLSNLFSFSFLPPESEVLLAPSFHLSGTITLLNFFSPVNQTNQPNLKNSTKMLGDERHENSRMTYHHNAVSCLRGTRIWIPIRYQISGMFCDILHFPHTIVLWWNAPASNPDHNRSYNNRVAPHRHWIIIMG